MAFLFKIQIKGVTSPPVWRKVIVPEQFSFFKFHYVIQEAFGWQNCHLFQFSKNGYGSLSVIGIPDSHDDDFRTLDSRKIKINEVFNHVGQKYYYIYDFGDDWTHNIVLEQIIDSKISTADCVDGKGACPPENSGGAHGYTLLKKTLSNPENLEYEMMMEWLEIDEDEWDPKFFDLKEAKEMVKLV